MKTLMLMISVLLPLQLWAVDPEKVKAAFESQESCQNFVQFDEANLYLGYGPYKKWAEEPRQPIPGLLKVISLEDRSLQQYRTSDSVISTVSEGSRLFVLTFSAIEEWDLKTHAKVAQFQTHFYPKVLAYKEHAQAFAKYQDRLIIAHGRMGVTVFNINSKRITNEIPLLKWQRPLESMAMGITIQGQYAYVMVDNYHLVKQGKPPFRGIVVIDLETEKVVKELDGADPGLWSAVSDSKTLIASYGGTFLWKYSTPELLNKTDILPITIFKKFPVVGHPVGLASMDQKYYYTCFLKTPEKVGGTYTQVPLVIDRGSFGL